MALPVTFVAGDVLEAAELNSNFTYLDDKNAGLVCVKAETAFSAVASFTADNVFTSSYTNYLMILNYSTSTSNNVLAQLRVAGVSAATNYNLQSFYADSTSVGGGRSASQSSITIADSTSTNNQTALVHINTPQLAQPTHFASNNAGNSSGYTSPLILLKYGNHSTATAYDGIGVLVATGTMTGTYAIYGYSKTV